MHCNTKKGSLTRGFNIGPDTHRQSQPKDTDSRNITTCPPLSTYPKPPPPRYSAAAGKEAARVRMTVFKGCPGPLCACALPFMKELSLMVPGLENVCFRIEAVLGQVCLYSSDSAPPVTGTRNRHRHGQPPIFFLLRGRGVRRPRELLLRNARKAKRACLRGLVTPLRPVALRTTPLIRTALCCNSCLTQFLPE